MMAPAPLPQPNPKPVADLLALMDAEQVAVLTDRLAAVMAVGYGRVALVVVAGQVEFVEPTVSVDVRRGRRRPRPA
jgi:hypothetical protein